MVLLVSVSVASYYKEKITGVRFMGRKKVLLKKKYFSCCGLEGSGQLLLYYPPYLLKLCNNVLEFLR